MARTEFANKVEDVSEQLARLRSQVEQLVDDRVTPRLAQWSDRAEHAARGAAQSARDQGEALTGRVRDRPVAALAIAIGLGFILGRVMR